jgi:hypothetical protein
MWERCTCNLQCGISMWHEIYVRYVDVCDIFVIGTIRSDCSTGANMYTLIWYEMFALQVYVDMIRCGMGCGIKDGIFVENVWYDHVLIRITWICFMKVKWRTFCKCVYLT